VSQVGIECFAARYNQEHRSEHNEAPPTVLREEVDRVHRVDSRQDQRRLKDVPDAEPGERQEPEQGDRPEYLPYPGGPVVLRYEERDQNGDGDRNDVWLEKRSRHLEPLHCAQDRNGRRDRPVTVEERRPEQAKHHEPPSAAPLACTHRRAQRGECQDPALAAVVGPEDERQVLDRDDEDQRPEDQ
jgi:hypothetical protein